jgi:L-amino acid N-acyltransferase YncA
MLHTITDPTAVWQYFNEKLGLHQSGDFRGVCHLADVGPGEPVSMDHVAVAVGYNGFIGRTCCMHVVIARPALFSRAILREAFEFPFLVAGLEAVLALVDSSNEAALTLDKRIGFEEIARIPNGGLDGDLVLLRMLRNECRWLTKH